MSSTPNQNEVRLTILMVLYNQKLSESEVYTFMHSKPRQFLVVVYDNSTQASIQKFNKELCEVENIILLGNGENIGLSKAYQSSISTIKKLYPSTHWVLILDQDTLLNDAYFNEILSLSQSTQKCVYYPSVMTKSGLFSPKHLRLKLKINLKESVPNQSLMIPINSGNLWPVQLFDLIHFDEALFLDMIDYDIFFQLYHHNSHIETQLMSSSIEQNFSGETISSSEKDFIRFKIYTNDFNYFSKKWGISPITLKLILFKRALHLNWNYKTLLYTNYLIKNKS